MQEQAKAPLPASQALRPQPASGTHELIVGMVMTEFMFIPTNRAEPSHAAHQSFSHSDPGQHADSSSANLLAASHPTSTITSPMAADRQQDLTHAASSSSQMGMSDLTGGAVQLQNPDGSLQYVVLTSDQQQAVQLSLQANREKQASTANSSMQVQISRSCVACCIHVYSFTPVAMRKQLLL